MFVGQLAAFTSMMLAASQARRQPRSGSYESRTSRSHRPTPGAYIAGARTN
jgi:hypothetical protein